MSSNNAANLSLAERIRLSREQEERERRRQAQEALHRLQEQSSHASAPASAMSTVGQEFIMRLNDVSVVGGESAPDEDGVNTYARQQQTGSGDAADANADADVDADAAGTDDEQQRRSLIDRPLTAEVAEGSSVFSCAPSFASGATFGSSSWTRRLPRWKKGRRSSSQFLTGTNTSKLVGTSNAGATKAPRVDSRTTPSSYAKNSTRFTCSGH